MRNFINELVQKVHKVGLGDGFDYPQMVHVAFGLSALSAVIFYLFSLR